MEMVECFGFIQREKNLVKQKIIQHLYMIIIHISL